MRADRLISLLMLLQTRGKMTAQDLARELEVSERTIYRDMDALSASGVPVYTEGGPGGGCALLDSYRTTLTGLNEDEARALFMLSVPAPLTRLGVSQTLKAALLKLSAALPASRADELLRPRIHLDSTWWFQPDEPMPALQTIHQAVWEDRKLRLVRRLQFAGFIDTQLEHVVEPYGLVAKSSVWYVVCMCEGHWQVFRVSQIIEAHMLDGTFERLADFDLPAFWARWCAEFERSRPSFPVKARVSPHLLPGLAQHFGRSEQALLSQASPPDEQGWVTLTLIFEMLYEARGHILAWGSAIEVLEPEALRLSIADFAAQIARVYS
jgi:predicted DNA-binding transcriptional regulator YafY